MDWHAPAVDDALRTINFDLSCHFSRSLAIMASRYKHMRSLVPVLQYRFTRHLGCGSTVRTQHVMAASFAIFAQLKPSGDYRRTQDVA
jgi:hypothetical protein